MDEDNDRDQILRFEDCPKCGGKNTVVVFVEGDKSCGAASCDFYEDDEMADGD